MPLHEEAVTKKKKKKKQQKEIKKNGCVWSMSHWLKYHPQLVTISTRIKVCAAEWFNAVGQYEKKKKNQLGVHLQLLQREREEREREIEKKREQMNDSD